MRYAGVCGAVALGVIGLSLVPGRTAEGPATTAFTKVRLLTAVGDPIPNGVLIIRGGKIVAAGPAADVKIPDDAVKVNLEGSTVIPGLVDAHSHVGLWSKPGVPANADGNESSGPVQPGIRAMDAVWPADPGVKMALAGGVTTANIMPGSANVIGGQTVYVKYRGDTIDDMRITGKLADGTEILGGLKMANGENPKGYGRRGSAPFTRMKIAALQREQFVKAAEYKAKLDAKKPVERDLSLEPLVEVLEKKRTVHFHCHRADDLMTAVRIAEEFGFELVLQHATEGYRVADVLAKKKIPVSLTLLDSPGGKAEATGLLEENAAVLEKAGVVVTINTDDAVTESRFMLRTGSIAVRGGMSEASALKALTISPAKLLHLDHRLGSLEPGKDADFVVLTGSPFSVYTKVMQTWIDGKKVFDAKSETDRPYRDGGFLLPRGTEVPKVADARPLAPAVAPPPQPPLKEKPKAGTVAVRAGRIHTAAGESISGGYVLIENGKITAVGKLADLKEPLAAETILTVAEVTPGLIDAHGSVGVSGAWNINADQDQDEPSDPNQADLRVMDAFNPHEPFFEFLRSNGITVVHACPGRVNVIGAATGVFRTRGITAEDAALNKNFAVLVNLGEVPKETFKGKGPGTRMAVAAVVRKAFADAQVYRDKKKSEPEKTAKNAKHEALLPALEGKSPVIFAAHRADDVRTGLRIADEFGLKPVVALGTEAFLMADELAKRKIPVIVHPTMQRAAGTMETQHTLLGNAAILHGKKIPVSIGTSFEGYVPKTRNLRSEAAMAAAYGLGHDAALRAITLEPAKLLGIDKDYGSLEVGKVADLVLYDGDPFEHATHVTQTIMAGKVVYDRAEYLKLPFERRILPLIGGGSGGGCCLGW